MAFGPTTLEPRRWMRAQGIARSADERTPEDRIGLMLALMAYVALNRPGSLDEYLQRHLLTWSPHFLGELAEAARHPFCQGLARLTKASLEGIQSKRGLNWQRQASFSRRCGQISSACAFCPVTAPRTCDSPPQRKLTSAA